MSGSGELLLAGADRYGLKTELDAAVKRERRAVLVVNTRSRSGRDLFSAAKDLLARGGLCLDATYPVRDPVRLPEIVQQAIAEGHRFVIVGGGDGTISSVVDFFVNRTAVLGILPLGTANSFARSVGIPLEIEGAVAVLTGGGKVADADLGKIDSDFFANTAAIGMPASVARNVPHRMKRYLGRAGYLLVAGVQFMSYRPFRCTVTVEGGKSVFIEHALDVLIANGPYQGGVLVAGDVDLESRDLVLRIVKGSGKWNLAKVWLGRLLGWPEPHFVETLRVADAMIHTDPPQYISVDGEVVARTPVRASIARQALMLMVPRGTDSVA